MQRSPVRGARPSGDPRAAVEQASATGGQPLPADAQAKLEGSLGADLSGVRVHTDGPAQTASDAVAARAFTVGQDIFFGGGQYDPGSREGLHLLGHEAAHTVENAAGRGPAATGAGGGLEISQPHQPSEQAADRAADRAVSGERAHSPGGHLAAAGPASSGGSLAVQRTPKGPTKEERYAWLDGKDLGVEGDLKAWKSELADMVEDHFGDWDTAKAYYSQLAEGTFMGLAVKVHPDLQARLTLAEGILQKDSLNFTAIEAAIKGGDAYKGRSPLASFLIRTNRNKKSELSKHSFGTAIDFRPRFNPNVQSKVDYKMVHALSNVDVGSALTEARKGGKMADLDLPASDISLASALFSQAFADESTLETAMRQYVVIQLGAASDALDDFTLDMVKDAKSKGAGALTTYLAERIDFAIAGEQQIEENREAFLANAENDPADWQAKEDKQRAALAEKEKKVEKRAKAAATKAKEDPAAEGKILAKEEAAKVKDAKPAAKRAAKLLVAMWTTYQSTQFGSKQSDKKDKDENKDGNVKDGIVDPQADGTRGSIAHHGFMDLPGKLVAVLAGSDGAGLTWLGAKNGDFMHFEL